jgi:hypothetical protein
MDRSKVIDIEEDDIRESRRREDVLRRDKQQREVEESSEYQNQQRKYSYNTESYNNRHMIQQTRNQSRFTEADTDNERWERAKPGQDNKDGTYRHSGFHSSNEHHRSKGYPIAENRSKNNSRSNSISDNDYVVSNKTIMRKDSSDENNIQSMTILKPKIQHSSVQNQVNIADKNQIESEHNSGSTKPVESGKSFASLFPKPVSSSNDIEEKEVDNKNYNDNNIHNENDEKYNDYYYPTINTEQNIDMSRSESSGLRQKKLFDSKSGKMVDAVSEDKSTNKMNNKSEHRSNENKKIKRNDELDTNNGKRGSQEVSNSKYKEIKEIAKRDEKYSRLDDNQLSSEAKQYLKSQLNQDTMSPSEKRDSDIDKLKEARDIESKERGPRTKGLLFKFNELGNIEAVYSEQEKVSMKEKEEQLIKNNITTSISTLKLDKNDKSFKNINQSTKRDIITQPKPLEEPTVITNPPTAKTNAWKAPHQTLEVLGVVNSTTSSTNINENSETTPRSIDTLNSGKKSKKNNERLPNKKESKKSSLLLNSSINSVTPSKNNNRINRSDSCDLDISNIESESLGSLGLYMTGIFDNNNNDNNISKINNVNSSSVGDSKPFSLSHFSNYVNPEMNNATNNNKNSSSWYAQQLTDQDLYGSASFLDIPVETEQNNNNSSSSNNNSNNNNNNNKKPSDVSRFGSSYGGSAFKSNLVIELANSVDNSVMIGNDDLDGVIGSLLTKPSTIVVNEDNRGGRGRGNESRGRGFKSDKLKKDKPFVVNRDNKSLKSSNATTIATTSTSTPTEKILETTNKTNVNPRNNNIQDKGKVRGFKGKHKIDTNIDNNLTTTSKINKIPEASNNTIKSEGKTKFSSRSPRECKKGPPSMQASKSQL